MFYSSTTQLFITSATFYRDNRFIISQFFLLQQLLSHIRDYNRNASAKSKIDVLLIDFKVPYVNVTHLVPSGVQSYTVTLLISRFQRSDIQKPPGGHPHQNLRRPGRDLLRPRRLHHQAGCER